MEKLNDKYYDLLTEFTYHESATIDLPQTRMSEVFAEECKKVAILYSKFYFNTIIGCEIDKIQSSIIDNDSIIWKEFMKHTIL